MLCPGFNAAFDTLKHFPGGREGWEEWPHQHPYLKTKAHTSPWGETATRCDWDSSHELLEQLPACQKPVQEHREHHPALCCALQLCKDSRVPQYLPVLIISEHTALSFQPLQRARNHHQILSQCQFFIWPGGFNRQDPILSMMSSIILLSPLSLKGAGVMKSPIFSSHFLSLTPPCSPAISFDGRGMCLCLSV